IERRRQGRIAVLQAQFAQGMDKAHDVPAVRRARAARLAGRTYKMAAMKNTSDNATSTPASAIDSGAGSDITRTVPSIRYNSTSIEAHWKVYTSPRRTPRSGNASGSALSNSQEPPGRMGARTVSQATHKAIRASSAAAATRRRWGLSSGFILLLSPDEPLCRARPRSAGGGRCLPSARHLGGAHRQGVSFRRAARRRRKAPSGGIQPYIHHRAGYRPHAGRGVVVVHRLPRIPGFPPRPGGFPGKQSDAAGGIRQHHGLPQPVRLPGLAPDGDRRRIPGGHIAAADHDHRQVIQRYLARDAPTPPAPARAG